MFPHQNLSRLSSDFYSNETETLAKKLLGKLIVKNVDGQTLSGMIVETEAYTQDDPASHSFKGIRNSNSMMFQNAGYLYVYTIYGRYFCGNIVSESEGVGAAVLIRGVEPIQGFSLMKENRIITSISKQLKEKDITNGPSKFCAAFNIDKSLNGTNLIESESIYLTQFKEFADSEIVITTRIGVHQGSEKLRRYYVRGNKFVSKQ
ncbi:MAG: DNA-3-methyladenine glycosylase [Ignavibacteriaceae bacterium]|nr:DNA-3-methyladenine glycosylase [Ignavibacteriaceae bacterium]